MRWPAVDISVSIHLHETLHSYVALCGGALTVFVGLWVPVSSLGAAAGGETFRLTPEKLFV